jgi:hypothetical protein
MRMPRLKWPDITPPPPGVPHKPLHVRLAWMAGLWAASLSVLLAVAWVIRTVLL